MKYRIMQDFARFQITQVCLCLEQAPWWVVEATFIPQLLPARWCGRRPVPLPTAPHPKHTRQELGRRFCMGGDSD